MVCVATGAVAEDDRQESGTAAVQPLALEASHIYELKKIEPTLTGKGVNIAVICRSITYTDGRPQNDYRPNASHNCFREKQFNFYENRRPPAGISSHSTAICSVLFGSDPNAFDANIGPFSYQAVAPASGAEVYEFWHFLTENVYPLFPPMAEVISASIGNQFEDWWTRGLDAMAQHHGAIVIAGIGNGLEACDPPLYPGASANVIGVGVIDSVNNDNAENYLAHFALPHREHSSSGPTEDGRCKPDIVSPGNCLVADANLPSQYQKAGNWSSFSTPIVAGTLALLVQKAKEEPNLAPAISPEGGNCVMKAILLNAADKLPFWHKGKLTKDDDHTVPLDYIQGAGALNAAAAYRQLIAGENKPPAGQKTGWDNNILTSEVPENSYEITIEETTKKIITATAAWNKHFSEVYPFEAEPEKDVNLRLELWAVDANEAAGRDYLVDYSDSNIDNLEHIYCVTDPNYKSYKIIVRLSLPKEEEQRPIAQRYGLAWSVRDNLPKDDIRWYDLNADGIVNEPDFTILIDNFLMSLNPAENYLLGDINADGIIDINDVKILLNQQNRTADWNSN
jgi:subtilisin family serine protease